MQRFLAGRSREEAGQEEWLPLLASWRFISVAESTIESKHAKVSLAERSHPIGPTRVSLANRLPLLERWLLRGHVDVQTIIHHFARARKLSGIAALLGFERHPALRGVTKASALRPVLTKIIYGSGLEDAYRSVASIALQHEKAQQQEAIREVKLAKGLRKLKRGCCFSDVLLRSMHDHFAKICEFQCYYSVPKHAACFENLAQVGPGWAASRQWILKASESNANYF